MSGIDQRAALERLIRERREDYAGLSRLLGRNPAYIQQFIKRGSPRKLDADDVHVLARYFGVSEAELGGRDAAASGPGARFVQVARLDVAASAGPGALVEGEEAVSPIAFDEGWLRQLCGARSGDLSFIRVQGDSMAPTLADGDDILVDRSDRAERLRDGIYVLRREDSLMVKRLAPSPAGRLVTIKSDNPAYPEWRDCDLATVEILGRVVWAGRRLR
ncbi:S24 family peptidase [Sphingosinicella terrae]|uniref:S24 family peptidase n=1 Tax=Sphingosinicella terrae TaxID=2172047 RepID=UPI000E0CF8DC|nr:S24 family peptidase [Sphingosinicella terrae]